MTRTEDHAVTVTNPEQRWVPVDKDLRVVRDCRRHVNDCLHFYPKGDPARYAEHEARRARDPNARVSYVRPATPEEMRTIPPCSTCGARGREATLVPTCPRCHMELRATRECECSA